MKQTIFYIILFVILSIFVNFNFSFIYEIDKLVLTQFNNIKVDFLDIYFQTITWIGSLFILIPLFLIILIILKKKNFVYINSIFFMCVGAVSSTYILKYIFNRARPEFYEFLALPFGPSYPSAHTTQITIFSLSLIFIISHYKPKFYDFYNVLIIFVFLSVIISRMYLQVHFLSDVIGGILVAMIWYCFFLNRFRFNKL